MGLSVYPSTHARVREIPRVPPLACPVWVQGTLGGEKIRKSLNLTSLEAAQDLVQRWKEGGRRRWRE